MMLSSYNGEKYIEEQIDSILEQKEVVVKLLVRDDGSYDSTPQILERYKRQGLLDYYVGENIGWQRSFMDLTINSPDYDYYAFSDQDDFWKPEKLIEALKVLKTMQAGPKMYTSNVRYWENGIDKGLSMSESIRTDPYHSMLFCESFGCTMLFNKQLMDIVKNNPPKLTVSHDFWFMQVASLFGTIFYDKESYILYRQHGNNQLGYDKFFWEKTKRRFRFYMNLSHYHIRERQAQELLTCYGHLMSPEAREIVSNVAYYRTSFRRFITLLFSRKYTHDNFITNLGLKYRVLLHRI